MAEPPFGHEPSTVDVWRILSAGAILAGGVILIATLIIFLLHEHLESAPRERARPNLIPPTPRLEAHPSTALDALRAQKQLQLESWGWVDERRQYAHIPIEKAMAIYVRQHAAAAEGTGSSDATTGAR